jgi:hypothetical protein
LLNKKQQTFRFTVGQPIMPDALDADPNDAVKALEYHTVHGLAANPDRMFEPAPEGLEPGRLRQLLARSPSF